MTGKLLSKIKDKPYFTAKDFALYHSDSLKILEQLPDNSVDMIFADPTIFPMEDSRFMQGKW